MFFNAGEAVRRKRRQFHIGLDPPVIAQPLDWQREVRGRHGGSADPLRRVIGEHRSRAAWAVAVDSVVQGVVCRVDNGRKARADVIEVVIEFVIEVVNVGSGRSFLASLDLFFNTGVVTLIRSLLI